MSAFMCSDEHIGALVHGALVYGIDFPRGLTAPELFAELVCENAASLRARYGKDAKEMIGEAPHRFKPAATLPAVHLLKLAQCYEYQACEHDGWATSRAKKWIDNLVAGLIYKLPGYDAAPWAI